MSCCDGWDDGEPDGECPDCGEPTVDSHAARGCYWSSVSCDTCGAAPCEEAC